MKDHKPLVSVIMNCFNSSEYLKEALNGVVSQTFDNWEIVFWDNQSTDESAEIFKSYKDDRFKYFYAPEHATLSTARNYAVDKAQGAYIAFLDCDDVWFPEKLDKQMAFFTGNNNVGVVYSEFEPFVNSDTKQARLQYEFYLNRVNTKAHEPKDIFSSLLHQGNHIILSTVVLDKKIFIKCGGFSPNLSQNEDYEILLKCSKISLAACTTGILTKYRIHASNNSFKNGEKSFIENRLIYSQFLPSKEVDLAIQRNEVKYNLFKLLYLKKISGLKFLLQKRSIPILAQIFFKRYLNK